MKKLFPVVAVAAFAMLFASCKKDYTCTCTITVSGSSSTVTLPFTKTTKSDAQSNCDKAKQTYTTSGSTADCHI